MTAQFSAKIGQRVLLTLTDRNGKPLPFGAMASSESQQQSIVDEGGVLLSHRRQRTAAGLERALGE